MIFNLQKILFTVIAICSLHQSSANGFNPSSTRIIPIQVLPNFPQTHERIIVPVDPIPKDVQIIKEFTSRSNSRANIQTTTPTPIKSKQVEKKPFVIIAKSVKNYHASPQIASGNEAPRAGPRNLTEAKKVHKKKYKPTQSPVEAQREHRSTGSVKYETTIKPSKEGKRLHTRTTTEAPKRSKQIKRNPQNYEIDHPSSYNLVTNYGAKPKKAGPNPIQPLHINTEIFNNSDPSKCGKPIKVHKEKIKLEKLPPNPTQIPETTWFDNLGKYHYGILHGEVFTEPPEYAKQRRVANEPIGENVAQPPPLQKKMFKGNYRDPKFIQPVIVNDHLGNFLYKSEVHFPTYRNHLNPPTITYGGHHIIDPPGAQPSSKELPPPIVYKTSPPPQFTPSSLAHTPKVPEAPRTKEGSNEKRPTEKAPIKNEEDDEEEEEGEEGEDYEEDGEEEDDGAGNDRYEGDAPGEDDESGDDEEEEESTEKEEKPRYTYSYDGPRSGESDEFDRAWQKYGYGPSHDDRSGSYESSETVAVPQRIKFYHEIKEESTTPIKPPMQKPVLKKITKVVAGKLNNTQYHPKVAQKPDIKVKSQEATGKHQQSDAAGSDDLKYFQYFNQLGNGMHTAGGRSGNDNHYVEYHERLNKPLGVFQKKVRWADKDGGFGEHYWDLNH